MSLIAGEESRKKFYKQLYFEKDLGQELMRKTSSARLGRGPQERLHLRSVHRPLKSLSSQARQYKTASHHAALAPDDQE